MTPARILLVEDTRDGVTLTRHALRKAGIDAELGVARSGEACLAALLEGVSGEPPGLPDLVLLDLKMPGMNGLDVLRRLRSEERTRYLPIVVLTSSHEPSDIQVAYALGANSYVRKPVNFQRFIEVVGRVTGYWLGMNAAMPRGPEVVRSGDANPALGSSQAERAGSKP